MPQYQWRKASNPSKRLSSLSIFRTGNQLQRCLQEALEGVSAPDPRIRRLHTRQVHPLPRIHVFSRVHRGNSKQSSVFGHRWQIHLAGDDQLWLEATPLHDRSSQNAQMLRLWHNILPERLPGLATTFAKFSVHFRDNLHAWIWCCLQMSLFTGDWGNCGK